MIHRHSHGEITRPRLYEFVGTVGFLGLRRRVYDGLVRLSGASAGEWVLDVGCGTGYFTRRAGRAVGAKGRVIGIDPSTPMIEYARRRAPSNCDFRVAGAEDIPEEDGSFDLVISSLAMHHIAHDRRDKALEEIFRVLRPNGRLFIADFRRGAEALRELVTAAGFDVTGAGPHRPFLGYLQATRGGR